MSKLSYRSNSLVVRIQLHEVVYLWYRRIDRTSSSSTTFLPMERLSLGLHFFSLCPDMNWTCRTSSSSTTFLPMEWLGLGLQQHFGVVNNSIRRIAIQPARRVGNNNANEIRNAALPPNPRLLHVLWQEYEFGIGGRKVVYNRRKGKSQVLLPQAKGYLGQDSCHDSSSHHGHQCNEKTQVEWSPTTFLTY